MSYTSRQRTNASARTHTTSQTATPRKNQLTLLARLEAQLSLKTDRVDDATRPRNSLVAQRPAR
jgi:hypothetical protein